MRLLRTTLLLAALLCSGCQLRLHIDVEVDRNGGGVLAVEVTADSELVEKAAGADADPLASLAEAGRQLADQGWRVREETGEDGGRTVTLSAPFADPEEFNTVFAQLSQALAADEAELLGSWDLAVTEDRVSLDGAAAVQPRRAVADYGLTPRRVVRLLERSEAFVYDLSVTLPGEVLSSNAGTTDGSTLHWTVDPGDRVAIAAEGVRPGPPWLRAAGGAVAGAVIAGGLLWLLARRSRRLPR